MSIGRQLAIAIGSLMVLIMGANFVINVNQLISHYEQQMQARADETVTTLSLSMTQSAQMRDDASLRSMVDVIFDRGYFAQVRFDYVGNDRFVARYSPLEHIEDVPKWFQSWVDLKAGYSQAYVSQGWQQLGTLSVKMNTSSMYQQLWRLFKAELAWFALMALVIIYGVRLLLYWQLKPLNDVLLLVDKLTKNQFVHIHTRPKAKEVLTLVNAMNRLSDRLQASFQAHSQTVQQLQRASFDDPLTQLNNKRGWEHFLQEWMTSHNFRPGWALMIQVYELERLNQQVGKTKVDELLQQVAVFLKTHGELTQEHVCLARTGGGDFWVYRPGAVDKPSQKVIEQLASQLTHLSLVETYQVSLKVAALPVQETVAPASLKHQLDVLQAKAQSEQTHLVIGELEEHTFTNWIHWQRLLTKALTNQQLVLFRQPLFDGQGKLVQYEIHSRLHVDNEYMNAGEFWPMIERLKLTREFDERVIELFKQRIDKWEEIDTWVINVSGASLNQFAFRDWLEEQLDEQLRQRIMLECSEYTYANLTQGAITWLHKMAEQGLRLSVDHIGTSGKNFSFLARFPLTQGKIQRRYIHDIHLNKEHRFFVAGMIQILHGQKALCLAEGVETDAEKSMLIELGVDGVMGYGLGEPERWR